MEETAQTNPDLLNLTRWVALTLMILLIAVPRLQQLQKGVEPAAFGNAEALAYASQTEGNWGTQLFSQKSGIERDEEIPAQAGIESEIGALSASEIPGPVAPLGSKEVLSTMSRTAVSRVPAPMEPVEDMGNLLTQLDSKEIPSTMSGTAVSRIPGPMEPVKDLANLLPQSPASESAGIQVPDSSPAQEREANSKSDDSTVRKEKKAHPFDGIIHKAAKRYEVDPALVKAIIMAESSYNPKAVSKKGARGLMQLMPRTAKALGVEDSFDPADNIDAGVRYFRQLLDQFNGNVKLAVAAYNAGSRKVKKYHGIPPFKNTRCYVAKVIEYHQTYQQ
jgi:hypothetical protein